MDEVCETCRFYFREDDTEECRKNPPTLLIDADNLIGTYWPNVSRDEWCGEWQKNPDLAAEV